MNDANTNLIGNVMQYSAAGGTIAAAIGYRVLSTIVDLGSSPSSIPEENGQAVGNNVSGSGAKASSILSKDWFWKSGSSSSQQYSASAIGFDRDTSLPLFTLQEVSYHDMPNDCWIVLYDRVYDITSFLNSHPGGDEVMLEYAGHDATLAFRGVGHTSEAEESLKPYLIGILIENERIWTRFFNMKSDVP